MGARVCQPSVVASLVHRRPSASEKLANDMRVEVGRYPHAVRGHTGSAMRYRSLLGVVGGRRDYWSVYRGEGRDWRREAMVNGRTGEGRRRERFPTFTNMHA